MKNVKENAFKPPRTTLQEKKNSCGFLIDEILADSYFSHNFLDVYVVQKRVLRLSKGLFREFYSNKEIMFDPHIAYQSYISTAEFYLTRKEILFILENLKLKKSRTIIFQRLFYSLPILKFVKTPKQSSSFLLFFKDFQSSKYFRIRFGIRTPEIGSEISSILSFPRIYNKIKEIDYLLKNQQFLIDYIQKTQLI